MNASDLNSLKQQLIKATSDPERIAILDRCAPVQQILQRSAPLTSLVQGLDLASACVVKQLVAIGQLSDVPTNCPRQWDEFLRSLLEVDRFYREMGGIVGYQAVILELLKPQPPTGIEEVQFHSPSFDDLSQESPEVTDAIHAGLQAMPYLAEFYPLGGAADRLHLVDETTGFELPAAKLPFGGRPLFETLIRDLQGREWLYYRLYGGQIETPIAVMTSHEKNNHQHVLQICADHNWFGRLPNTFRFFSQPLVPTVDETGRWLFTKPLKLHLKPGGHGALWKLARDEGVFDWLRSLGSKKALVRQINNPIAGLDYGLLAFVGLGFQRNLQFGFASCPRLLKAAEGMIVLKESRGRVALTNVEYCDFAKFGIEDAPVASGNSYSRFRSNTNILFADLASVEQAINSHPFPGLLMNARLMLFGDNEVRAARLESTMQNIADAFEEVNEEPHPLRTKTTFVTYNQRHKTISVAKKAFLPGGSPLETPEQCFYDKLLALRELLAKCGFCLPPAISIERYLAEGPDVLFLYHPALGPLYSVIAQKLRGGHLSFGAEWILEIAEADIVDLAVTGSLQIRADRPLGALDSNKALRYSDRVGRCILQNVVVRNRGVDWSRSQPFWKMGLHREESCEIELKGHSEFDAQGVVFEGAQRFCVPDGVRMIVRQMGNEIVVKEEPIAETPLWRYSWDNGVRLERGR